MSEQNVSVVRGVYESFGRGDIPAVLAALDPAIEWHSPEELPYGGRFHGPEAVLGFFETLGAAFDSVEVRPDRILAAEPDTVLVTGRGRLTAHGDEADVAFAHVLTVREGRVTTFREFTDTGRVLALFRPTTTVR